MFFFSRHLPIIFLFLACGCGTGWHEEEKLAALFREAGVRGTFVLLDTDSGKMRGLDRERATTRFSPASTFKIANSLIGLSVGAVSSVDASFSYNGEKRRFPEWERAMGLRDAMRVSNVPVYQELARRIGLESMQEQLTNLGYGNMATGDQVDNFWLNGTLTISALEQVRFLERLAHGRLPFPEPVQAAVREIMLLEETADYALYGKTGWGGGTGGIGWWVGWVRRGKTIYCFALNIDVHDASFLPKRIELGKAALRTLGIIQGDEGNAPR